MNKKKKTFNASEDAKTTKSFQGQNYISLKPTFKKEVDNSDIVKHITQNNAFKKTGSNQGIYKNNFLLSQNNISDKTQKPNLAKTYKGIANTGIIEPKNTIIIEIKTIDEIQKVKNDIQNGKYNKGQKILLKINGSEMVLIS